MATLRQQTSFGPGRYRGKEFTVEKLQAYANGTNQAIAAGIPIPLLKRHAPIDASDDATMQFAKEEGAGWITRVGVDAKTGNLWWEAKDVPTQDANDVRSRKTRFTSPEFRPVYTSAKAGVYSGQLIRHFAFSIKPGNPHQSKIEVTEPSMALDESETCWQFDESERKPLTSQHDEYVADPARADSSYTGSKPYEGGEHTGASLQRSADKSINWDTLLNGDNKPLNEVLDAIHRGLTSEDNQLGMQARFEREHGDFHKAGPSGLTGNPPSFAPDEGIWDKAKKVVGDRYGGDSSDKKWAVVTSVYKNMGGKLKSSTQHDEVPPKKKATPDDAGGEVTPTDASRSRADSDAPLEDKGDKTGAAPNIPEVNDQNPETNNPDLPPKATDKSKLKAIIAGLAQKNVVVPSDWDPTKEGSMDILLGCLNSAIAAENKAEAEAEPDDPNEEPVTDAPMPFDETEQFAEGGSPTHRLLRKHGYSQSAAHPNLYSHPLGHKVTLIGDGWKHTHANGKVTQRGDRKSLKSHLARVHSIPPHGYDPGPSPIGSEDDQFDEQGVNVMFTPEEIAAAPEALRAKMTEQNKALKTSVEKVQQFDEERKVAANDAGKVHAVTAVKAARIPRGLKTLLLAGYEPSKDAEGKDVAASIQFDEGEEQPVFTAVQVAEMVAKALPKNMQFDEGTTSEADAPKAKRLIGYDKNNNPVYTGENSEQFFETDADMVESGHVSSDAAEALVKLNPAFQAYKPAAPVPSRGDLVKTANDGHTSMLK
jgi:hypothetical protein